MKFTVSASHPSPKYALDNAEITVEADSFNGFSCTLYPFGSSKSKATPEAAIRSLLGDNGCENIRITANANESGLIHRSFGPDTSEGDLFQSSATILCEECDARCPDATVFTWRANHSGDCDLLAFAPNGWTFGDVIAGVGLCPVHSTVRELGERVECACGDCASGKIQSVAGPACSLPAHEYEPTTQTGERCWNCGAAKPATAETDEETFSTYCGSMTEDELREHIETCGVCKEDNPLFDDREPCPNGCNGYEIEGANACQYCIGEASLG